MSTGTTDLGNAVPQGQDTLTEERVHELRAAAEAGNRDAVGEYARLCLLIPNDEFECWLHAALRAHRNDTRAAIMLAASLTGRVDAMVSDIDDEDGDRPALLAPYRTEVERLYAGVLATDPGNAVATAGRAALRELMARDGARHLPPAEDCSWYLVERETPNGSVVFRERLVVTDPAELRWACNRWAEVHEEWWGEAFLRLHAYRDGVRTISVDLEPFVHEGLTDWAAVPVPPLPGRRLPAGHPVRTGGRITHYGLWPYLD